MTRWTRGNIILLLIAFIFMIFPTINVRAMDSNEAHNHFYSYEDFESKSLIVKIDRSFEFTDYDTINISYIDDDIVVLSFDSIEKAINSYESLKDNSNVNYIEPDMVLELNEDNIIKDEDEIKSEEKIDYTYKSWGIEHLGIDKFAKYIKEENKNNVVTIAVIDSGVDYNHPIFKDKLLDSGYDFTNNDTDPYDDDFQGHGTHVAGIIADGTKMLDNIKIMPIKALNSIGIGTVVGLGKSIKYAIDSEVDIINLSLGFKAGAHSKLIEELILEAINSGITVVNAAGNYNINTLNSCPSHIDEAIIVSSIDVNNNKAYTSNYGPNIDVAAPGVNIYSAFPGGTYIYKSGTSMAAPHISVIAAMLKAINSELMPVEIENIIKKYSVDIGEKGVDWFFGSGVPNMSLALPKIPLQNVFIDKGEITLEIGQEYKLNLGYYPENSINDLEVLWESSNDEVATVANGQVLGLKEGEVMITVAILDKIASCKVIVKDKEEKLDLEAEAKTLDNSIKEDITEKEISKEKDERAVELLYLDTSYKSNPIEEIECVDDDYKEIENNINYVAYNNKAEITSEIMAEDKDNTVIEYADSNDNGILDNNIENEQKENIVEVKIYNNYTSTSIGLSLIIVAFIGYIIYRRLKR